MAAASHKTAAAKKAPLAKVDLKEKIPDLKLAELRLIEFRGKNKNESWKKMLENVAMRTGIAVKCALCQTNEIAGIIGIQQHLKGKRHERQYVNVELAHPTLCPKPTGGAAATPKKAPAKVAEAKATATKALEAKAAEAKTAESKAAEAKDAEAKLAETKATEASNKQAEVANKQGDAANKQGDASNKPTEASNTQPAPKEQRQKAKPVVKPVAKPVPKKTEDKNEQAKTGEKSEHANKVVTKTVTTASKGQNSVNKIAQKDQSKKPPQAAAKVLATQAETIVIEERDSSVGKDNKDNQQEKVEENKSATADVEMVDTNEILTIEVEDSPEREIPPSNKQEPSKKDASLVINPAALRISKNDKGKENKENVDNKINSPAKKGGKPEPPKKLPNFLVTSKTNSGRDITGLVGVEYVVKTIKHYGDKNPQFECALCEVDSDATGMEWHLKGLTHRLKYLDKHFPTSLRQFENYRSDSSARAVLSRIVEKICVAIERYHGRDLPFECIEREYSTNRHGVMAQVFALRHASEYSGPSFTNVVDKKTLDELASNKEPLNESLDPKHKPVFDNPDGAHARRHKFEPQQLDMEEHKKLVDQFLRNTALDPPHSRTRSRSHDRAGRHERRRSFGRSRRSASRSPRRRSRSGRSPYREGDIWDKYRRMVDDAVDDIDRDYRKYKKDPESHPAYNAEWKEFWTRRSDEIAAEGKDPSNYNFQPEWILFWIKRMNELYHKTVEDIKIKLRLRLGLSLLNSDIKDPRYHIGAEGRERTPMSDVSADENRRFFNERSVKREPVKRKASPELIQYPIANKRPNTDFGPRGPGPMSGPQAPMQSNMQMRQPIRPQMQQSMHPQMRPINPQMNPQMNLQMNQPMHPQMNQPMHQQMNQGMQPQMHQGMHHPQMNPQQIRYPIQHPRDNIPPLIQNMQPVQPMQQQYPSGPQMNQMQQKTQPIPPKATQVPQNLKPIPSVNQSAQQKNQQVQQKNQQMQQKNQQMQQKNQQMQQKIQQVEQKNRDTQQKKVQVKQETVPSPVAVGPNAYRNPSPVRSKPEVVGKSHDNNKRPTRETPSSKYDDHDRRENKREDEDTGIETGPLNTVSVLRLLTALEEHLGSLGPKINDLLAKALTLEKVKANSSDEVLAVPENGVLLETVREKLRGQLLAGMLENSKVRAVKQVIKDITTLLNETSQKPKPVAKTAPEPPKITLQHESNDQNVVKEEDEKRELATKLATALAAQGKTDFTSEQLEQLVAVYSMIEKKQRSTSGNQNTKSLSDTLADFLKPAGQAATVPSKPTSGISKQAISMDMQKQSNQAAQSSIWRSAEGSKVFSDVPSKITATSNFSQNKPPQYSSSSSFGNYSFSNLSSFDTSLRLESSGRLGPIMGNQSSQWGQSNQFGRSSQFDPSNQYSRYGSANQYNQQPTQSNQSNQFNKSNQQSSPPPSSSSKIPSLLSQPIARPDGENSPVFSSVNRVIKNQENEQKNNNFVSYPNVWSNQQGQQQGWNRQNQSNQGQQGWNRNFNRR